jgi:hypothetical protein
MKVVDHPLGLKEANCILAVVLVEYIGLSGEVLRGGSAVGVLVDDIGFLVVSDDCVMRL